MDVSDSFMNPAYGFDGYSWLFDGGEVGEVQEDTL